MTNNTPKLTEAYPVRIDLSEGYSIRRYQLHHYDIHKPDGRCFGCDLTLGEAMDFAYAMGRGMVGIPIEQESRP